MPETEERAEPSSASTPAGLQTCAKCGATRCGRREPWCPGCQAEDRSSYREIYRAWVVEHRAQFLAEAGVPPRFQGAGLDNFEGKTREAHRALDVLVRFAAAEQAGPAPAGLYLHGPVGTGKTHLAVAALLEHIARRRTGLFVTAFHFLLEAQECFRLERPLSEVLERYATPGVLVLDDLGAEKLTEFTRAVMVAQVDRAYARQRPRLIVSSNLDLDELGRKLDQRIASRLRELCHVVRVGGTDYRRRLAAQRD